MKLLSRRTVARELF